MPLNSSLDGAKVTKTWTAKSIDYFEFAASLGYPYQVIREDGPPSEVGLEFGELHHVTGSRGQVITYATFHDKQVIRFLVYDDKINDYFMYAFKDHREAVMFKLSWC